MSETLSQPEETPEEISPEELERQAHEKQWMEAEDPGEMLNNIEVTLSDRKSRLFLLGCFQSISDICPKEAIELAEKYADGLVVKETLAPMKDFLSRNAHDDNNDLDIVFSTMYPLCEEKIVPYACKDASISVARLFARHNIPTSEYLKKSKEVIVEQRESQANLLRDIIRNPFAKEKVEMEPAWYTQNVIDLARSIYEEKAFDRMPILADALMDAGCENEEIINHCRGSECPHVRGCWVVDMILGKQ